MWTPPPQTLVDAVRVAHGLYDDVEIVVAWYGQTAAGTPWGVCHFVPTYETMEDYLTRNKISRLALQADTLLGEHLGSFSESRMDMHEDDGCYVEDRLKAIEKGRPLPHSRSAHYRDCKLAWHVPTGRWVCTYEPEPWELASELDLEIISWSETIESEGLTSALRDLQDHPRYRRIRSSLNYYARNRRSLAEALERRRG